MAEHRYPERTVAPPPGQPITVGLRVPHELPAGAAGRHARLVRARRLLRPYVEAGCRSFNLIPVADSEQAAIDGAAEVRALLGAQLT